MNRFSLRPLRRTLPGVALSAGSRTAAASGSSAGAVDADAAAGGSQAGSAPADAASGRTAADPLDVCLLSYRSDPFSGGQGVYVKHLSRELAALGHSVDVISGRPYPDLDPAVRLIELPGPDVVEAEDRLRAFEPGYLRSPAKLFEWASVLTGGFPEPYTFGRRVKRYFRRHAPDYDVVHDNQSLCYGLLDLLEAGIPTVATVHHPITVDRRLALRHADGLRSRLLVRRWFHFLKMQKAVARELPHVITVSHASKRRTVADFGIAPEDATVIHNGIDADRYRPLEGVPREPTRLITTISSDVPLKGLCYLLEAFARVLDRRDAELVLVGEPDDDGPAARTIHRLGVGDHITTYSEVSDRRLVELYASAAVAVVPSLFEGFGLPAGEAMACGVPVVATTGGGLPEVVGDAGVLVPPGDPGALAGAVADLLDDPDRRERMGRAGRQRVRAAFDWTETARRTAALYRRTIHADR